MRAVMGAMLLGTLLTGRAEAQEGQPVEVPELAEAEGPALFVKKMVLAQYPASLKTLHGDDIVSCTVWVRVDDRGRPERAAALQCPDGLHLSALEAVGKWQWEPYVVGGRRVAAETTVTVSFGTTSGRFSPGYVFIGDPEQVTSNLEAAVHLKSGKMPSYPAAVAGGSASCDVSMRVTSSGSSASVRVTGCTAVYRKAALSPLKGWKWYPSQSDVPEVGLDFRIEFRK